MSTHKYIFIYMFLQKKSLDLINMDEHVKVQKHIFFVPNSCTGHSNFQAQDIASVPVCVPVHDHSRNLVHVFLNGNKKSKIGLLTKVL